MTFRKDTVNIAVANKLTEGNNDHRHSEENMKPETSTYSISKTESILINS